MKRLALALTATTALAAVAFAQTEQPAQPAAQSAQAGKADQTKPLTVSAVGVRDFALLWESTSTSLLGDGMVVVALAVHVAELSAGPQALALVTATSTGNCKSNTSRVPASA